MSFRLVTIVALATASSCVGCNAEEVKSSAGIALIKTLSLGAGEKAFMARDINGDSRTDLIVAEESENRIAVLLNDAQGGFNQASHNFAGSNPTSLTLLDFDRDGDLDVAVANHEIPSIFLLEGNGIGGFTEAKHSPVEIITEPHSHMIDAGDFNNDGFEDLIVDSRDQLGVYILSGQPDGTFTTPGTGISVGGTPYLGFALGDINNDGSVDIVTPNGSDVSILLNRSESKIAFDRVSSVPVQTPFAVALGDINGDGLIDLVVGSERATSGVTVLFGDGQGNFTQPMSFPIAGGAKTIATGDVNADGLLDVVVTSWNADIRLLLGGSALTWQKLPIGEIINPWSAVFGDFDSDGRDEIVVGDASSGRANVYSLGES